MPTVKRTNPPRKPTALEYIQQWIEPETYGSRFAQGVKNVLNFGQYDPIPNIHNPIRNSSSGYNNDYMNNDWHCDGMYLMESPFRSYATPYARHSIIFATLTPKSMEALSDEEKSHWRMWDPTISNPESKEEPIYYRVISSTPDSGNRTIPDGEESYWPVAHYLFEHGDIPNVYLTENMPKQVWGFQNGTRVPMQVYNSHICLPPTNIHKILTRDPGDIPIGRFIDGAMEWGSQSIRDNHKPYEAWMNNCHKNMARVCAQSPYFMPGWWRTGGLMGGSAKTWEPGKEDKSKYIPFNIMQQNDGKSLRDYAPKEYEKLKGKEVQPTQNKTLKK